MNKLFASLLIGLGLLSTAPLSAHADGNYYSKASNSSGSSQVTQTRQRGFEH